MTRRLGAASALLAGLGANERAHLVPLLVRELDVVGMTRAAAAWFARLDELAKLDPFAAGTLARAMWGHLQVHRPETPTPLDAGFVPTGPAADPRGPR